MGTNVCQKGKRVERDLVHFLKDHGCAETKRSQQHCGAPQAFGQDNAPDVISYNLPSWHIECKGVKKCGLNRAQVYKWYDQVNRDAKADQCKVILAKANNQEFVAILPFDSWLQLRKVMESGAAAVSYYSRVEVGDSVDPFHGLTDMVSMLSVLYIAEGTMKDTVPLMYYGLDTHEKNIVLVIVRAVDWVALALKHEEATVSLNA